MPADSDDLGRLPHVSLLPGSSSFTEFVAVHSPDLLPARFAAASGRGVADLPHGTTIVALTFADGVIMAADRQVTAGSMIGSRHGEKIYRADEYSSVGTAGTAGIAVEIARLFQVELEHYEKIEGTLLSLDGKANRLSGMVRDNLPLAMQGMAAIPLFAGYDPDSGISKIFNYDAAGGRSEIRDYHAIGSGSIFARGALKKLYQDDLPEQDALLVALQAIYDAGEEDTATMGPDLVREIYPRVHVMSAAGNRRLTDAEVGELAQQVVASRRVRPDGPRAAAR
ncbi:proteasome subunit beta [Goodfellowiella coeruleoviolacea]|uniref:Proteasome subunit beta n=1 Tax=Goodfellowiella coeruleoviolacea TaxID=334858 RepID=A0AAE3GA56_9PSEU|nr:proteasome subunit beta [Goodfellowiella coeruleoviolacea]MCP2163695.1 proteasome beta subunit [Goodfellowiella coeruleoviolacea]